MRRLLLPLAIAVILRMAFQALFVPAFEGADEPQHLARILDFAARPFREAFEGRDVAPRILAAVAAFPCRPELAAAVGCPPYGQAPGAFDLLRRSDDVADSPGGRLANVEANQPPFFYMSVGLVLRPFQLSVSRALLAVRLLCVALVALALFGPLRVLARRWPSALAAAGLLALLLPGASEALARCSNDAAVFLWTALVLAALDRRTSGPGLAALIGVGPLVKLTAIPIVVFAVVVLARERSRGLAAAVAAASLAVFPMQAWRGWFWGGTLELNAVRHPIAESWTGASLGYLRSAYAFVKTTFWVGGMSRRGGCSRAMVCGSPRLSCPFVPRPCAVVARRMPRRLSRRCWGLRPSRSPTAGTTASGAGSAAGISGPGVRGSRRPLPTSGRCGPEPGGFCSPQSASWWWSPARSGSAPTSPSTASDAQGASRSANRRRAWRRPSRIAAYTSTQQAKSIAIPASKRLGWLRRAGGSTGCSAQK
jgi:Glycosyltransferase family 87